jgi:hypothetical protein
MARPTKQQRQIEGLLASQEPRIREAFLKAITEHKNGVNLTALIVALEAKDIDAAINIAAIPRAMLFPMDAAIASTFVAGGQSIADMAPGYAARFGFDGRATRAAAWASNHIGGLVQGIVDDQRDMLRSVISQQVFDGKGPRVAALEITGRGQPRVGGFIGLNSVQAETVRNVAADLAALDSRYFTRSLRDKRFDGIVRKAIKDGTPLSQVDIDRITARYADRALAYRGKVIARTESITALRAGRREGLEQAVEQGAVNPERVTRKWNATGDARTRIDHAEMDGQEVQGLDEPFTFPDGSQAMYPGDSSLGAPAEQIAQCRCFEEHVIDWLRP